MNLKNLFIVGVALLAIVTGAWLSYRVMSPAPVPQTATVLPAGAELAEFSLVDQTGAVVGRDIFLGQWDLVFFGFTHCPDICPLTLQTLASAKQQLAAMGQDPLPRIVLVSVDPERDTPELMAQYLDYFGTGNLGITGELDELRKLTNGLGIFFEKESLDDNTYTVNHSAVVLLINPAGEFHAIFGTPHDAANYVHDLPIIMGSR